MSVTATQVPRMASNDGVADAASKAIGAGVTDVKDAVGEITITVERGAIVEALRALRDTPGLEYQQLVEIAGVDYPERAERFEVNYHLLSLTRNHRIRVKVLAGEGEAVPSVTALWPVAGWLEREVFDMYGVPFDGNADLRRILTDYNFDGHPFRKDFPLTGHVELRYSESQKRVVYEPVSLPQDFRSFDFLMPWQGPEYQLPGDEKATAEAAGAPSPAPAPNAPTPPDAKKQVATPKTTDKPSDTGAGKPAEKAATKEARKPARAKAASPKKSGTTAPAHKASRTPDPKGKGK